MKKLLLIVALLRVATFAQTSTNVGPNLLDAGTADWFPLVNANMTAINPFLTGGSRPPQTLNVTGLDASGNITATGVQNAFKSIDNMLNVDGIKYATIASAVTACGASPCVITVPSDYAGADPASCPSPNVTIWDFRSQVHGSNPPMYAINIWDGCPASKWTAENSGGQPRAKHYVGYQPQTSAPPGDLAELLYMQTTPGTWPSPGRVGNIQETLTTALGITGGTDTITNAATNQPNAIVTHEFFATTLGSTPSLLNDVRAATGAIQSGTGVGQINSGVVYAAVAMNLPAAVHVASTIGLRGEDQATGRETLQLSGTVLVINGSARITWVSGDKFAPQIMPTYPIVLGGVTYKVASCTFGARPICAISPVYAASTGTVAYTFQGRAYAAYVNGNQRYSADGRGITDPNGGGGILFDAPSDGSTIQKKIWFRDLSRQLSDGTYDRMGYFKGPCSDGSSGMVWTDGTGTRKACLNSAGTAQFGSYCNAGNGTGCITPPATSRTTSYPVLVASLTTGSATSDNVTIDGMTASGHCTFSPTNAGGATNIATAYVSAKSTNQITITHAAFSGMTYDIQCTAN